MKKTVLKVMATVLSVATIAAVASCGTAHEHSYGSYLSDETGHWKECVDGDDKTAVEEHVFDNEDDAECNVCGYTRTVKTRAEKILDFIKSLDNVNIEGTNAYATSYEDMVKYLKDKGVIEDTSSPVDMNTNAGYLKKYDGTFDDVMVLADKAYDYNGVYLLWWDFSGNSTTMSNYTGVVNNGSIVVNGGMYTMPVTSLNGAYAIAFKGAIDKEYEFVWDSTSEVDYMTQQKNWIKEARAPYADQIATFEGIDNQKNLVAEYTVDELAAALQKQGFITVQQLGDSVNLNAQYSYIAQGRDWIGYDKSETGWSEYYDKTFYVSVASTAKQFGDICIYHYDSSVYGALATVYEEVKTNTKADGTSSATLYYTKDGEIVKFTANDKAFSETGSAVTLTFDLVIGGYAFSIQD